MSTFLIRKRILGVDYGRVRIGLAISDELGLLAHPLTTVPASPKAAKQIAAIAQEREVERVVIGLPRHMDGSMGESAREVLGFAEGLRQLLACEVITWDERLSTTAANRAMRESGRSTRGSRAIIDQVAAQMILQGYLDKLAVNRDSIRSD